MMRYLVVAYQTATNPELTSEIKRLAAGPDDPEFALLVPAYPVQHRFTWNETESRDRAEKVAAEATDRLRAVGARVVRTVIGSPTAILAIDDELRDHPGYDALIISTFPQGRSAWLKEDLVKRAQKEFGLPVIHVIAHKDAEAAVRR
jgi:hypothetical protein